MSAAVAKSSFQVVPDLVGDDDEDTDLLRSMAQEARDYIGGFRWAPPVSRQYLAFGVGGILALFLMEFERAIEGFEDRQLWTVVGDLPPAYFVTDECPAPRDAIETYCQLMEDWADQVLSGRDLSDAFPIEAAPTQEHAQMLKSRLEFIRTKLIP